MMIHKTRRLVLILFVLSLHSCSKDDDALFKVGTISDNSVYQRFDIPFSMYPSDTMYSFNSLKDSIDVDHDGQNDFVLMCQNELNHMTLDKEAFILIINNTFEIAYEEVIDTANIYIIEKNDTIYEFYYSYFKPFDHPDIDTLIKENYPTAQPKSFENGQVITDLLEWYQNDLYFSEKDSSLYRWDNLNKIQLTNYERGRWNECGTRYLVFRQKESNKLHFGWLKLEINSFCNIKVYESYFQNDDFGVY